MGEENLSYYFLSFLIHWLLPFSWIVKTRKEIWLHSIVMSFSSVWLILLFITKVISIPAPNHCHQGGHSKTQHERRHEEERKENIYLFRKREKVGREKERTVSYYFRCYFLSHERILPTFYLLLIYFWWASVLSSGHRHLFSAQSDDISLTQIIKFNSPL